MAKDDDFTDFEKFDNSLDAFFAEDGEYNDAFDDEFSDEFSEEDNFVAEDQINAPTEIIDDKINFNESKKPVSEDQNNVPTKVVDNKTNINKSKKSNSEDPLLKLNVIVLEMDWEISDTNIEAYISEINNLMVKYKNDRPIYLFFKLHAAIGEYILIKKARSHPDALKFMYGIYSSLKNALADGVPLVEKNRLILAEVNNFKSLKKKLFPGLYPDEK